MATSFPSRGRVVEEEERGGPFRLTKLAGEREESVHAGGVVSHYGACYAIP